MKKKILLVIMFLLSFMMMGCSASSDDGEKVAVKETHSVEDLMIFSSLAEEYKLTEDEVRELAGIINKYGVKVKTLKKGEKLSGEEVFLIDPNIDDKYVQDQKAGFIVMVKRDADKKVHFCVTWESIFASLPLMTFENNETKCVDMNVYDLFVTQDAYKNAKVSIESFLMNDSARKEVKILEFGKPYIMVEENSDYPSPYFEVSVQWSEKSNVFGAKHPNIFKQKFVFSMNGDIPRLKIDVHEKEKIPCQIKGDNWVMHTGASNESSIICKLKDGDLVNMVNQRGSWVLVVTSDDICGWIPDESCVFKK